MIIVFTADESFVQHFLVSLNSILSTNSSENLSIYLLHRNISEQSKCLINRNVADHYIIVHFVLVDMEVFKGLMISKHITIDAYFRLSIPDLLPANIHRVIYLDCDTITNASLEPLWNLNLEGKAFAAVPDMNNIRNLEMGLGDTPTFNSGVMVIDVDKWRQERISRKLFKFLAEFPEKIKFHDQDALNEVLLDDILELPVKWNLTTPYIRIAEGQKKASYDPLHTPAIIHFNGDVKPWHYRLRHPYKDYYYKYLSLTPFSAHIPDDRNLNNILRKYLALFFILIRIKNN